MTHFSQKRRIDEKIRQSQGASTGSAFNNDTLHRKNFPRTRQNREGLAGGRNLTKKQSPFNFPSCSQTLAYLQWWEVRKKRTISGRNKVSQKSWPGVETAQKPHVKSEMTKERIDPHKVIAMTDVHPEYFTELSGRPVKEKFSLEQYILDIREVLRTRLLIGRERDDCIRIDQQFEQESNRLQKIQNRHQRYVNSFEEFLSKDHKKSMNILERAELEAKQTAQISVRRNELAKQYGQIRLDIYFWEENWRMVKMCQLFLYRLSPIAWRIKHDWLHRLETGSLISVNAGDLFGRYGTPDDDASLEDLIELFEQDIAEAGPAELYFEDPFELIQVFRTMETQNLNALIHLESLAGPMADVTTTIAVTEARIKQEVGEISSTIDDLKGRIAEAENRAASLEKYADQLLRGVFRDLVCSEEVLHLRVFVEDAYETCVGPNDANLDSFSMMKWVERTHEELNLQLDNLPRRIVRACEKEGFRQEMKATKEAEDAARKFELMHQLLSMLKRIMQPPKAKKRPLIRRSAPIVTKAKLSLPPAEPTVQEMRHLAFFTDFCKCDNSQTHRSKLPYDFDPTFQSKALDGRVEPTTLVDNDN
ncbi:PREDICTED: coiled-coil domain-containing protein 37-like [Dinoponera quadriceps]|uniref:Coiled-coil domain-containing protein 37-like n=1 Tax=Dinoponera quadriceps TaxID=609295 RepID=A0A6P3YHD5_DINQU|nr:PREDICTED: coiled-coil domain-containing protein 37-like [Dinoponera quadriceps]